ncbi:MAG: type II toxin-antitoxin system RelE/ParE family toxin [Flavobacteriales bacterium]
MISHDVVFSQTAKASFEELFAHTQEASLISAEKLRAKIFHKLHQIKHHPLQGSKSMIVPGAEGNFRLATALNVKIYYKVEDSRIIVLELLLDKSQPV